MALRLHIEPSVQALFAANGLASAETFLDGDVGEVLSSEPNGRQVRRIRLRTDAGDVCFYLKRRQRESVWRLLAMLGFGRKPQSGPMREKTLLDALRGEGFAAMEPVAWGERSTLGIPRAGFIVVRHVEGRDVADVFEDETGPQRLHLIREIGLLVGRLHRAGFMHPVRFKDLFLRESVTETREFVLIDRETSKPWRRAFDLNSSLQVVARAARRTLRDKHRLDAAGARGFLRGYAAGVGETAAVNRRELTKRFVAALRKELKSGRR